MSSLKEMWRRLPDEVDVAVIGGGITGAGIARDAARRGLRVALFEEKDLAFGTSSRSSKLVHGGLRYLESYEFSLVFESVSERRVLLDLAPHLVSPLAFLFPVYEGSRQNIWMIQAGMWLYEGLSLFRSPKPHRRVKPQEVPALEPALRLEGLQGAPLYYDCSTNDARLTLENALDAIDHGALVLTGARVTGFIKDERWRIQGVTVHNTREGTTHRIRAHAVINATGPWTDRILAMSSQGPGRLLRPTKGVHIVVDHDKLPVKHAVVCFHPTDERVLFTIPWGNRTYVGTTDTDYSGVPGEEVATLADVDYLIDAANAYFPRNHIERDDVIATWAGLRPLIAPEANAGKLAASKVSREHQVLVGEDGLITIAGGKLTTYRKMAEEVVDTAVQLLRLSGTLPGELQRTQSDKAPLPGAVGWPPDDDRARIASQVRSAARDTLSLEVCEHLVETYGMRAFELAERCVDAPELREPLIEGRPEIVAQVDWSVSNELASSVSDVMIRRTELFYRDVDQGLGAADKVARRMAEILGWADAERQASLDAYRQDVAASRRWRTEIDASTKSPSRGASA